MMRINNLFNFASYFEKIAKAIGITTYHGGNASNLPSILEKGMLAKHPFGAPHAAKGVYVTNNVEAAARYCRDFDKPVILEIYISSPKRVNKLKQDPLDLDESLHENYDSETFFSEDVRRIENGIKNIFNISRHSGRMPINLPDSEIENFRGFSLYEAIKDYAKSIGANLEDIKKKIKEFLPPQELDYLNISNSGHISLLPSVYDRFHQMYFPKDLPAKTIKAVWIPKNKLKEGIVGEEEKSFGKRLIPGDIRAIERVTNNFRSQYWKKSEDIDLDAMESIIEELDQTDWVGIYKEKSRWSNKSFLEELEDIKNNFESLTEDEREAESGLKLKNEFYDKFRDLEPLEAGEVGGEETWVKIPMTLEKLSEVPNYYKESEKRVPKIYW